MREPGLYPDVPEPGTREWLRLLTASKIAAVVGTSPYQSRFSLWHLMKGNLDMDEGDKPEYTVGHVLENALIEWAYQQLAKPVALIYQPFFVHPDNDRFAATPDAGLEYENRLELIEAKTARYADDWRDGVPVGYYDQVQWQLFVSGAVRVHVAALVAMELKFFTVERDEERIQYLALEGGKFLADLDADKTPSITDGSTSTYLAVRELHPDINGERIELDGDDAKAFCAAVHDSKRAEEHLTKWKALITESMDQAKTATFNGHVLAHRQARGQGTPYIVAARNLPTPEELETTK